MSSKTLLQQNPLVLSASWVDL